MNKFLPVPKALLLLSCLVFTLRPVSHAQEKKIITLKQKKLEARPVDFYIADVKDTRPDTADIGSVRAGLFSKKSVTLDLPGGAARGIADFLHANLVQPAAPAIPLTLHISRLEVAEKTGGLSAESEVSMTLSFFTGDTKLIEYNASSSIRASLDAGKYIESLIRQNLDTIIYQASKWVTANKTDIVAAAKGPAVLVTVIVGTSMPDTSLIVYSLRRPLTLDDFHGRPDNYLPAAAATYSGIDITYNSEIKFGQPKVTIILTSIFEKARSWCRSTSRNLPTLQHEQRHFDITALKTCELAEAFRNASFTAKGFVEEINILYKQKQAETIKMQDDYDNETKHGQLDEVQKNWNARIVALLQKQGCFPG